jgi:replication-associated recombination protein RarA
MTTELTINDIVFGSAESKSIIEDIISGAEPMPSPYGKTGILLYGVWGTGKTALANLLPNAIEIGTTGNELGMDAHFIGCQQGYTGPQVMADIKCITSKVAFYNSSGNNYIIIDEVDVLSEKAQESLKTALNSKRTVFVLTTNNLSSLDKGLLNRCILVEMNAASVVQLTELARKLTADINVVLDDAELVKIVSTCGGSVRNLADRVRRYARRKLQDIAA